MQSLAGRGHQKAFGDYLVFQGNASHPARQLRGSWPLPRHGEGWRKAVNRSAQNPAAARASWPFARGVWFLDLQTTGTAPEADHIIEVAWTRLLNVADLPREGDGPPRPFSTEVTSLIIRPPDALFDDRRRLNRIRRLTGLSADQLAEGTSLVEVWREIRGAIEETGAPCLIHYASFEKSFLNQLTGGAHFPFPIVCTHALARHAFPDLPSKSLRAVAGHLHHAVHELKRASGHLEASMCVGAAVLDHFAGLGIADLEGLRAYLAGNRPSARGQTLTGTRIDRKTRLALPHAPGVYRFIGPQNTTLYVGKATSLKSRVNSYFRGRRTKGSRLHEMLSQARALGTLTVTHPVLAPLVEAEFIKLLDPPYNRAQRAAERSVAYLCVDAARPFQSQAAVTAADAAGSGSHVYGPYPSRTQLDSDVALLNQCFFGETPDGSTTRGNAPDLPFSAPTLAAVREALFVEWGVSDDAWSIRPLATLAGAARRLLAKRLFAAAASAALVLGEETLEHGEDGECAEEASEDFQRNAEKDTRGADASDTEDTEDPLDSPEFCAARVRSALRGLLKGALRGKRLQTLQNCTIALSSTSAPGAETASKEQNADHPGPSARVFHIENGLLHPEGVLEGESSISVGVPFASVGDDPVESVPDPVLGSWMHLRQEASQRWGAAPAELLRHDLASALMAELKRMCNRPVGGHTHKENRGATHSAWIRNPTRSHRWIRAERFLYPLSIATRSDPTRPENDLDARAPAVKTT